MKHMRTYILFAMGMMAMGGCKMSGLQFSGDSSGGTVPAPINLMLPKAIRIHPFTGARTFDEAGGIRGIDVRMEANDSYGDAAKAFGTFRFELYRFVPNSIDPKGRIVASWEESIFEPKKNLLHWDKITRTYQFKLQWDKAVPIGKRFVLVSVFSSPFSQRLTAERVFISGE